MLLFELFDAIAVASGIGLVLLLIQKVKEGWKT